MGLRERVDHVEQSHHDLWVSLSELGQQAARLESEMRDLRKQLAGLSLKKPEAENVGPALIDATVHVILGEPAAFWWDGRRFHAIGNGEAEW